MAKFKVGDIINPKIEYSGFHDVTVTSIDEKYYHLRIINGTATVPIKTVDENYELR